jgi:hypothetical protein
MPDNLIVGREERFLTLLRRARVAMTVGKVLLWMDLLLLCFVYVGLRSGSKMWLLWVLAEGVLGLVLVLAGAYQRRRAQEQLDLMSPQQRAA